MRNIIVCALLLVLGGFLNGVMSQIACSGWVVDENNEPLPFVVVEARSQKVGALTDLNGFFQLALPEGADSIQFRSVGYATQMRYFAQSAQDTIVLRTQDVAIADVVILPGVNPALRIMRNAIEKRRENRPEGREAFSYRSYNKLAFFQENDSVRADTGDKLTYLFLMETVTDKYFQAPGRQKEIVWASKISGYPGKALPLSATDLQTLSFYENTVSVFGSEFRSPVSPAGFRSYKFVLEDTLLTGTDSLFTLHFYPANKTYNGFDGWMTIHSKNWEITSVHADLIVQEPELLVAGGEVRQIYTLQNDSTWFPTQLNTHLLLKPLSKNSNEKWEVNGDSWLMNVQVNSLDSLPKFNAEVTVLDENAGSADTLLVKSRPENLTREELRTYRLLDSLGREFRLPQLFDQINKVAMERLEVGPVDFDINRFFTANEVENWRPGIGVWTNEKLLKWISVGGYVGYGTRDRKWKYGTGLRIMPFGNQKWVIGGMYDHDLVENAGDRIGRAPLRDLPNTPYLEPTARRFLLENMNYIDRKSGFMFVRLLPRLSLRGEYAHETATPANGYQFVGDSIFDFQEAEVLLRWAPGEKYVRQKSLRFAQPNRWPVFKARVSRGIKAAFGEYDWWKFEASVDQKMRVFRQSVFQYRLNIGQIDGFVPLPRAYVFPGAFVPRNFADFSFTHNTMRLHEFAADQYAELFLRMRPQLRWLKLGSFQPKFTFISNFAWGKWTQLNPQDHQGVSPVAPEDVFMEVGLLVQNILPTPKQDNLMFSFMRTFGFGAYYRVGAYALPTWQENIAFRFTLAPF